MRTEQLYEQIEAYLTGTLPEQELRAFEEELRSNPQLASEVELHRQLNETLSDKAYVHFRQELQSAADAYRASEDHGIQTKKSANKWLLGLTIITILLIALYWIYKSNSQEYSIPPEQKMNAPLDSQDSMRQLIPSGDSIAVPKSSIPQPKQSKPVYSPFDPNNALELAIAEGSGNYFTLSQTILDAPRGEDSKTIDISFHSRLQTALDSLGFQLHILSNKTTSNNVLNRLPVEITLLKEDVPIRAFAAKKSYRLSAMQTVTLSPGLYYVRLYHQKDQAYIWTSKFSIVQN